MGVGVVRGESAVGVPLRRLFRHEWMDVMYVLYSKRMLYLALHMYCVY
jgi:hypothetical protein